MASAQKTGAISPGCAGKIACDSKLLAAYVGKRVSSEKEGHFCRVFSPFPGRVDELAAELVRGDPFFFVRRGSLPLKRRGKGPRRRALRVTSLRKQLALGDVGGTSPRKQCASGGWPRTSAGIPFQVPDHARHDAVCGATSSRRGRVTPSCRPRYLRRITGCKGLRRAACCGVVGAPGIPGLTWCQNRGFHPSRAIRGAWDAKSVGDDVVFVLE